MFITEIFKSIQGEGTRAGLPCVFVRLTGCNLRCTWCDTAYAFHGGKKMSVDEVMERVEELAGGEEKSAGGTPALQRKKTVALRAAGTMEHDAERPASESGPYNGKKTVPLVELTGGEPLLQEEIYPLAERLVAAGYTVMIETSGECFVGRLPREVIKIVDVKCPDSGEADTFNSKNLEVVDAKDEIKFVLSTRRDYEFARDFTREHALTARVRQVLFSPAFADPNGKWPGLEPRGLVEWILADGLPVRLGLELQKVSWMPATEGR